VHNQSIDSIRSLFTSRLDTLDHLLKVAKQLLGAEVESLLQRRLAPDMFPFGAQIAFTCDQPRNFALWCRGERADNLNPQVFSIAQTQELIADTKALLGNIDAPDSKLAEVKRIELGGPLYVELPGMVYVNDFLIPNFYFHIVTAYAILRMTGAPVGKRDYMIHLAPYVKQA
jgi:uncharacterized protein